MLIDVEHGFFGDPAQRFPAARDRATFARLRDPAQVQHVRYAPRGVGAATEPEEIDTVARLVVLEDRFVAVGDIVADAGSEGQTEYTRKALTPSAPIFSCAKARIVECDLVGGVDAIVDGGARRPVELVDVRQALVGFQPAVLTGAIGKYQNVFRHGGLPRLRVRPRLQSDFI